MSLLSDTEKKDRLILFDGHSIIYRSFYALPGFVTSDGFPTNAVYGYIRTVLKILRNWPSSRVALTMDSEAETLRKKKFRDYKANRPEMPDHLSKQIPVIEEITDLLGINILKKEKYEADDLIGTLTKLAGEKDIPVLIVSNDKDLMQLVRDGVKMIVPSNEEDEFSIFEEVEVEEKLGVPPETVPELFSLKGDSSDNIPGVPQIGKVRGKKLLDQFSNLEEIYRNIEEIDSSRIRKTLRENRDQAFLSRQLVELYDDIDLGDALEKTFLSPPDEEKLREKFGELEFTSLLKELPSNYEDSEIEIVREESDFRSLLDSLKNSSSFAIDLETTSLDPFAADLLGISISLESGSGHYIPVRGAEDDLLSEEKVLDRLGPIIEDEEKDLIGQNLKFDIRLLSERGIEPKGISFDSMIASYLLKPSRRNHNLKEIVGTYLDRDVKSFEELFEDDEEEDLRSLTLEEEARYAIEDAEVIWDLKRVTERKLRERDQMELFRKLEIPLIAILAKMEHLGIKFEESRLRKEKGKIKDELSELKESIDEYAETDLNPNSPKQVREVLFEKLDLPVIEKTKTGPSTNARVLRELSDKHPLPEKIMEYRELSKLLSTYINKLPEAVREETGRIHTSFNQTATATGRLSSSDPNLQNIPKGEEFGADLRRAFVAPEGKKLLGADYSQVELRLLAHLSGDKELINTFREGHDLHRKTASEIFDVPPLMVDEEMRDTAKRVNFGIVYGITNYGLSRDLGVSRKEAKGYIERFFSLYPETREFIDELVDTAEEKGYAETFKNRRRYLPNVGSSDWNERGHARRNAINTPIQGGAADLIKMAMIEVRAAIESGRLSGELLLQVHDELILEVDSEEANESVEVLKEVMEDVMDLKVPLKADVEVGDDWGEI